MLLAEKNPHRPRSTALLAVGLGFFLFFSSPVFAAVAWFQNGSVSPTSGDTATSFSYNVEFKVDPAYSVFIYSVLVIIDGGAYSFGMENISAPYTPGWYSSKDSIKLPQGNHTYHFYAYLVDMKDQSKKYYINSSEQSGPNVSAPPQPKAQYQVKITNNDDTNLTTYYKTNKDSSYQGPYNVNANGGVFNSNLVEVAPGSYSVIVKWKYPEKTVDDSLTSAAQQINAGDTKIYSFVIPKYTSSTSTTTTTTTSTTTSTSTTSTSTTSTTLGASYHLKIINNDDDNYAGAQFQLERQTGGLSDIHSAAVNSGQTVITPSYPITPGSWRSILIWTDPDKGTQDIYRDGGYVTIEAGQDHEFTKYVPLCTTTTSSSTTTTSTTTSTTATLNTTTTSSVTTTTLLSPQINLFLPTTEVCGYVKYEYWISGIEPSQFDRIEILVDSTVLKTFTDQSCINGLNRNEKVDLWEGRFTPLFSAGAHNFIMRLYFKNGGYCEQKKEISVENVAKLYIEKNGSAVSSDLIKLKDVENYQLVIRVPQPSTNPVYINRKKNTDLFFVNDSFGSNNTMAKRESMSGYEYVRALTAYDFPWGVDDHGAPVAWDVRAQYDYFGVLDNGEKIIRLRTIYSSTDYTADDLNMIPDAMTVLDKFISVLNEADSNKLKIERQQIFGDGLKIGIVDCGDNKYLYRATAEKNMGGVITEYNIEVGSGANILRVIEGQKKTIFGQNQLQDYVQEGQDIVQITLKDPNTRLVSQKTLSSVSEINMREAAFGSVDEAVELAEYIKASNVQGTTARKEMSRYLIKTGYDKGLLKDATGAAKVADKALFYLSIIETANIANQGGSGLNGLAATLASLLAGKAAASSIAPVIVSGVGATGLAAAAVTTGVVIAAGGVAYIVLDDVAGTGSIPGTIADNDLSVSIRAGETAALKFAVVNSDDRPHEYEVKVIDLNGAGFVFKNPGKYALPKGNLAELLDPNVNNFKNHEVYLESKTTMNGDFRVKIVVTEDPDGDNNSWELAGQVHIDPFLGYPPWVVSGSWTGCIPADSPGCSNCEYNVDGLGVACVRAWQGDVNLSFENVPYAVWNKNFSGLYITESDSLIDIKVPAINDTSVLAVCPATITINNYASNYCTIKHNGTVVYQNGSILDNSLITSCMWDQAGKTLTLNVTHWDNYTIISDPSMLGPKINTVLIDGRRICAGDYVSSQPMIETVLEDKVAGISELRAEVLKAGENSNVQIFISALSSSTIGETNVGLNVGSPIPEGSYYIRLTVTDTAGNSASFETPWFRVSSAFNISALAGPNPFSPDGDGQNDSTKISYQLSSNSRIKIRIVDLGGRQVRSWDYEPGIPLKSTTGYNEVIWDGKDQSDVLAPNGLYLCYILADSGTELKKQKLQIAVLK
jgi:hypothetical protein